jgi:NAD(P)-dependent dehydrogenase (short-subunit alcohol dehydrogenase family)
MLDGKTVFVSGGTGSIGEAVCRVCAQNKASVIFSYHTNEKKADELLGEIPGSRKIRINMLDLRDIAAKTDELFASVGVVDALINNAGISQVMPYSLMEEEDYDLMMDMNVKGTFFLTRHFVRMMIRNKKGSIVNIGSIAGNRMYEVPVHYAVSKAAITGFTFSLASELKRYAIRVNSVVPGLIDGGISRGIPDNLRADFVSHCAAGRAGTPMEVAELVAFLASDRASYINGQNIMIDGGI